MPIYRGVNRSLEIVTRARDTIPDDTVPEKHAKGLSDSDDTRTDGAHCHGSREVEVVGSGKREDANFRGNLVEHEDAQGLVEGLEPKDVDKDPRMKYRQVKLSYLEDTWLGVVTIALARNGVLNGALLFEPGTLPGQGPL